GGVSRGVRAAAEARRRQSGEQLGAAERARAAAEQRLRDAEGRIQEARRQAAEIIEGAGRSGEQFRTELRARGEEEARRIVDSAMRDIEAERRKAIDSVRAEVADLVVVAPEKVVGDTLDDQRHRKLIADAIAEVATDSRN